METLYINGGKVLNGDTDIVASKNALLPILAGSILVDGDVDILEVAYFSDVNIMIKILESLGSKVSRQDNNLHIDSSGVKNNYIQEEYTKLVRSSIFMLGPLLSRLKKLKLHTLVGAI